MSKSWQRLIDWLVATVLMHVCVFVSKGCKSRFRLRLATMLLR